MHQLALALQQKGYRVSGSDDEIFEPAKSQLSAAGLLPPAEGWFPEKIDSSLDAIILGMHAKADNPELLRAQELGLPVYSFPEYIYRESREKKRVVVGGSHGKTTTTSMIMHVLKAAGQDFDYLVGARLPGFERSVRVSDAPLIVCEGDEYPASTIEKRPKFHFLHPHIAILTGIAWDHINVFPTFDNYLEQFRIFIQKIESGGHLIYNETDAVLKSLVEESRRDDISYHPYSIPQHRISSGQTVVQINGEEAALKVFGNHNLLNLEAARIVCELLGVSASHFADAISTFTGAARRLELLAEKENAIFYRDFAHAPSKVKATVEAVRQQYSDRRIIVALELHTFSSLSEKFLSEYHGALDGADEAAVFYSPHALALKRLPDLPAGKVLQEFGKDDLKVFTEKDELEQWLGKKDFKNAVMLFMSSGNYDGLDVEKFSEQMIQSIR